MLNHLLFLWPPQVVGFLTARVFLGPVIAATITCAADVARECKMDTVDSILCACMHMFGCGVCHDGVAPCLVVMWGHNYVERMLFVLVCIFPRIIGR